MRKSKKKRRIGLLINYSGIILILVIYYVIKNGNIPKIYLLLEVVPLIVVFISFSIVFGRTGLWRLIHHYHRELDERELQVVYKATSLSYGVFIIVTLIIIYTYAVIQKGPIDVMMAAALLYFAHTLPAAIIACQEKRV